MAERVLQTEDRQEIGKNANRRLRASGRIPAVIYGSELESRSVSIDPRQLLEILQSEAGQNSIFKVKMGGKASDVLIRDYQLDPRKGTLVHADLLRVAMDQLMQFEVPIEVVGEAPGVTEGGILDMVLRAIEVECLPGDVPDNIPVDVSELGIGNSLRINDLTIEEIGFKVLSDGDLTVLSVVAPAAEEEPEVEEEEELEEGAEPEVIQKGKDDGEGAEDGESAESE